MNIKSPLTRLAALALAACLLAAPAGALTVDQARELLAQNYVDVIDPAVLDKPTIGEMLGALGDPYTQYMDAGEYAAFLASMEDGTLGGIGITSSQSEEGLRIDTVMADSPAQTAGLEPGDVIVAVDGQSIAGMEMDQAVALIRGEPGTTVNIGYLRQGRRRSATVTRDTIVLPSTTGQVLEGGVGYIDCDTWGTDTLAHFWELMTQMDDQVGCWLIDLRGNVGGMTAAATDVAGLFCPPGDMLSLRFRSDDPQSPDGYAYQIFYPTTDRATGKPTVVLVDGDTASASEAFVAAMREYDAAVAVGERTFGKGVAQGLWDRDVDPELFADGDCLKITMARFYSPIGNTNDTMGLLPDFPVDEQDAADVALALARELAGEEADHQAVVQGYYEQMVEAAAFADCAHSPYAAGIAALAAHGLVSGKADGLFHPRDTLTRAELAQLLVNILNSRLPQDPPVFDDVAEGAWYAPAVSAIAAQGFMEGTGPDRFSPEGVLTNQELITVVGRMARWLNDNLDRVARQAEEGATQLRVLEGYAPWARPGAWLLSSALESQDRGEVNLLWDEPEAIDPTAPVTREAAAQLLHSLLSYLDILP